MPTPQLADLMPNPAATTGDHHLIAPGAAEAGYQLGPETQEHADARSAEFEAWVNDRKSANADRALAALAGPDPVLHPVTSTVRPLITQMVKTYEKLRAGLRADPAW